MLSTRDADALSDRLLLVAEAIARELSPEDRGFTVTIVECDAEDVMLNRADTERAVAVLACSPNGVLEMSRELAGLVEFSRNLGVITTEGNAIQFSYSTRSAIESRIDATVDELDAFAALVGARAQHHGRYPGWAYAQKSPLRDAYMRAYEAVCGEPAKVNVIHAGLECGMIASNIPDMDIISIGPTMYNIHSPDEALDLSKTEIFWQTLVELFKFL